MASVNRKHGRQANRHPSAKRYTGDKRWIKNKAARAVRRVRELAKAADKGVHAAKVLARRQKYERWLAETSFRRVG